MRHFGHASPARTDRPDSVNDPSEGNFTSRQRVILGLGIIAGLLLGTGFAHGYYLWLLK